MVGMAEELFIAARLPEFEKKTPAWFRHNKRNIEKGKHQNVFWEHNTIVLDLSWQNGMRALVERLIEFGYEMNAWPEERGEFSIRGGTIIIWPVNERGLWRVDFFGNAIEIIEEIAKSEKDFPERKKKRDRALFEYLRDGDYIVHIDHGIGIWGGIEKVAAKEYFLIEYRGPARTTVQSGGPRGGDADTLHVPISEAGRISPYIGFRAPQVTRLGTPLWKRTLKKTKEDAVEFAKKLLTMHAARATTAREAYSEFAELEEKIASGFLHEETPAQKRVIKEVFADLASPAPMDRIIIGDVGFGKTEVALRASARVAASGKQVALLAPTTLLCDQHYRTWQARFKDLPVSVARLSRLESGTTQKKILGELSMGTLDIIVGTHRLLSRDVVFKNLGLLVVDEEQRFGVRAKEHLKNLKKDIDVLTLSATPLPRTLSLALSHVKRMSVLEDAPLGRLAPETLVLPYDKKILKLAIEREIARRGQIYILENRIHKIPKTLEMLAHMLPERKIGYIHGRVGEKQLVETMEKFRENKIEILVSTTIIENGIDLASVNTLIVSDSTLFGLADLHQLRGRVGRGDAQAYAYFFYNREHLPKKAEQRLDILQDTQFLGAGSVIAEKDLEMRGAGNILGREQSGAAARVGLNLYSQFLADAVEKLRAVQS